MKLLPSPFVGKVESRVRRGALRTKLKWFVVINLVAFLLLPKAFYGFYGMVGAIGSSMVESRIDYNIRSKNRTLADLRQASRNWEEAFKGMNPMEWGK